MSREIRIAVIAVVLTLTLTFALATGTALAEVGEVTRGGFSVTHEVVVPVDPETAYDAFTGDVSAWWDHSFSEKPSKLYIEAKPGGGFYEIFDESGDGAKHAEVITAQRGKLLRLTGPLGLAGHAINFAHTFTFEPVEGGTKITLVLNAVGQVNDGWPEVVDRTWHHFLVEQFVPYVEGGGR
jgi:uncharacterized protein YndB with AHSA1/START domain